VNARAPILAFGRLRLDGTEAFALAILAIIGVAIIAGSTPVTVISVLLLVALAALRPEASVVALPAVIGFVYQEITLKNARFSPQEALLATTVAGTGLHVLWRLAGARSSAPIRGFLIELRSRLQLFDLTAVALLLIGTLSLFTLALPAYRHESLRVYRWVILEPVIYYALARWYLHSRALRKLSVVTFVAGALLVAAIGIVDLAAGRGLEVEGVTRISGVYPHPNALALFLERPFVLVTGLAAVYCAQLRWYWLIGAAIVGGGLLLTFSRGAVLAVGVVVVCMLFIGQRRRLAALAAGAGALLGGALALTASARIDNLFSGGSGSLRLDLWSSAIEMIRDHPIFGIGLDQFLYVYAPRYVKPEAWSERFTSHPHDIILDSWLSLGIMGLVLALAFVGILIAATVRIARKRSVLGLAAAGAMFAGILHGLVDNGYFLPDLALIFWFLTAIIAAEAYEKFDSNRQET
jgi:O-antigen ligase